MSIPNAKRKLNTQEDSNDSSEDLGNQNLNLKSNTNLANQQKNQDKFLLENKIRKIIEHNFDEEINYKKYELDKINERISEAQNMLDKLRVCIICNYYSLNGRLSLNEYINHPAVSNLKCEHLESTISHCKKIQISNLGNSDELSLNEPFSSINNSKLNDPNKSSSSQTQQFEVKISVGNVSKYLNNNNNNAKSQNTDESLESSQYDQDLITHKWMIYIRSSNCLKLDNYIKKVIFYLHSSYKPYDMVEVKSAPFQLVRRGWGEFPIHVQIHFKDARNKRADINHNLKLDWTQTGLQTFGGETSCTTRLVLKPNDFINETSNPTSKTKPEDSIITPSTVLHNPPSINIEQEINSCYSIESNEIKQSDSVSPPIDLKRNFSSSSLSSSSNSSYLIPLPLITTKPVFNNSDLPPSNFISTEIETSSQTLIQTSQPSVPISNNPNFDELIQSFCTTQSQAKKQEEKQTKPPSVDELLNLRPKSIQLMKAPIKSVGTVNKLSQINTASFVIPKGDKDSTKPLANNKPSLLGSLPVLPINKPTNSSFLNSLNKKLVIYKVGSEDVNNSIKTIKFNEKDLLLIKSQTTAATLAASASVPSGLNLTMNKKVKLSSDQLTKIKNNNSLESKVEEITTLQKSNSDDFNVHNLCSVKTVLNNLNCKLETFKFEGLIRQALANYPIINNLELRNFHSKKKRRHLSFSARSIHEFYSWPYAKRKASEWIRALYIKRKCSQIIESLNDHFKSKLNIQVWSTKCIVLWLRSHGYTPLEYQHMLVLSQFDNQPQIKDDEPYSYLNYVDSLSPLNKLFSNTKNLIINLAEADISPNDDDCFIDVVNLEDEDPDRKKLNAISILKQRNERGLVNESGLNHVEMCDGSKHVREQLDMLDIRADVVSLVPSFERPGESNVYTCNLVEKLFFALAKRFAEDLIRKSCSDIYFDGSKSNLENLNNTSGRKSQQMQNDSLLMYQKFPQNLKVLDVFNTIVKHEKYDFLTNKYMASASTSIDQAQASLCKPNANSSDALNNNQILNNKSKSNLRRNYSDSSFNNK